MTHPYPVPEIDPVEERYPVLSSRQEAFCRHFVATGNAADAARRSGYAPASARQTGHALLQRPHIVARVRQIRMLWREAERAEARILLARLEQAWDAAAARGSAWLMYLVIRKQEALSGLGGGGEANRGALWPVPCEDEFGELGTPDADLDATAGIGLPDGPLAGAVRLGRDRAERERARRRIAAGLPVPELSADAGPEAEADRILENAIEDRRALGRALVTAPRPTVLQAVADAAPEAGPVADDPPEDRYARGGLPVPRTGPDLQPGDDAQVDLSESFWMQDMRAGDRPTDPWSEAELAIDEEIKARYAESPPAESPAGSADEPADEPAGGDPAPEEAAQAPADDAMHDPEDEPPAAPEDDWFAAAQAEIGAMDRAPGRDAGLAPAGPAGEPAAPAGP
ncbi:MAG: terminase small subunit [Rhodospirillaceae bacterium]|nr:terminase small subunit [Rhodospirillaceae bacterium]MDE0618608.1 terminase small subunit [Rhodospirillaceae bacterium]